MTPFLVRLSLAAVGLGSLCVGALGCGGADEPTPAPPPDPGEGTEKAGRDDPKVINTPEDPEPRVYENLVSWYQDACVGADVFVSGLPGCGVAIRTDLFSDGGSCTANLHTPAENETEYLELLINQQMCVVRGEWQAGDDTCSAFVGLSQFFDEWEINLSMLRPVAFIRKCATFFARSR
jgi:hypothetical protein